MSACHEAGCGQPVQAKGLCVRHYRALRASRLQTQPCNAPGCERPQFCRLLCRGHYARAMRGVTTSAPVASVQRGNVVLAVRVPHAVMARLQARAAAAGTTANRLAARLLVVSFNDET